LNPYSSDLEECYTHWAREGGANRGGLGHDLARARINLGHPLEVSFMERIWKKTA